MAYRYEQLFEGPCEEIDAAMFSGDLLEHKKHRERLKALVARWGRAIEAKEGEPDLMDDEEPERGVRGRSDRDHDGTF